MNKTTFILFGSTGDLAKRKIYPALYNLFLDGHIKNEFIVIGLGRKEIEDSSFQEHVEKSLREFSRRNVIEDDKFQLFLSNFHYTSLDISNENDYRKLNEHIVSYENKLGLKNRLFYFSVSPEFFEPIALNISNSGLGETPGWKRLMIEKPFGHDLKSAQHLNEQLSKTFSEDEIFRIDHYLGKTMVQNLKTIKFKNPLFSSIWNKEFISNVQITAIEKVGVEERASYYDHSGALRDMFQNHLLQVLSLVAMDDYNSSDIRSEKKNILNKLKPIKHNDIVRAQYDEYKNEPGVSPNSTTETYLAARVFIDNDTWRNVPFYIRTGKKTHVKSTKVVLEFKENELSSSPNSLVIEINPNEMITLFINSDSNSNKTVERIPLGYKKENENSQEAYEKLIYDALIGDSTFFAHWDEIRLSWEFVQPILDSFEKNSLPLSIYKSGTNGPKESDDLLLEDRFKWN